LPDACPRPQHAAQPPTPHTQTGAATLAAGCMPTTPTCSAALQPTKWVRGVAASAAPLPLLVHHDGVPKLIQLLHGPTRPATATEPHQEEGLCMRVPGGTKRTSLGPDSSEERHRHFGGQEVECQGACSVAFAHHR
jgi:hypothetical protein